MKATDKDVPKLFSWLGIRPDIKAHARVEIHTVKEESGFLPLAVPEIDPNFVYAIFVDYASRRHTDAAQGAGAQEGRDVRRCELPLLGLGAEDRVRGPRQHAESLSTRTTRTATARASSSSSRSRMSAPAKSGT